MCVPGFYGGWPIKRKATEIEEAVSEDERDFGNDEGSDDQGAPGHSNYLCASSIYVFLLNLYVQLTFSYLCNYILNYLLYVLYEYNELNSSSIFYLQICLFQADLV